MCQGEGAQRPVHFFSLLLQVLEILYYVYYKEEMPVEKLM